MTGLEPATPPRVTGGSKRFIQFHRAAQTREQTVFSRFGFHPVSPSCFQNVSGWRARTEWRVPATGSLASVAGYDSELRRSLAHDRRSPLGRQVPSRRRERRLVRDREGSSFWRMWAKCVFAVCSLTTSSAAISWLENPRAMSLSTSSSRVVSSWSSGGASRGDLLANSSISRRVTGRGSGQVLRSNTASVRR